MTEKINIRSLLENFSLDKDLLNSEPEKTKIEYFNTGETEIPKYINEFWTIIYSQLISDFYHTTLYYQN